LKNQQKLMISKSANHRWKKSANLEQGGFIARFHASVLIHVSSRIGEIAT
jgi:hypothetical protein